MVECLKQGHIQGYNYYGASGDMPAHGVQGLAGERLCHGISLWLLHSHNSSARSKSSDVLCRLERSACLLKNQPMLVCNWGGAYIQAGDVNTQIASQ